MEHIVELRNIRKEFPGVVALDNVNLVLTPGRVHALVGENGAGKSTLMKILSGSYTNYEGELIYQGKVIHLKNEKDALDHGISIVAQELNPIPQLTIAENVFLGREPQKIKGILDRKGFVSQTKLLLAHLGLDYNPNTLMADLSVAQKQMIEIIKAISRDSKVIILDEPTSALTYVETSFLFEQIKALKQQGIAIVFISHKLDEVFEISDDVSVLRDGRNIGSSETKNVTQEKLIAMMVGREVKDIYPVLQPATNDLILDVQNLCSAGTFKNISFQLHKGEILGFTGMMGAGRSEIMRAVFGLDCYDSGKILLDGAELKAGQTKDAIKHGIAMVTEDRTTYGFVGVRSITDNIVLPNSDLFMKHGFVRKKTIAKRVADICALLNVKTPNYETLVSNLSGGNQQKVVLSKWLVRDVKVLIMDEPTRGIDVGSKQEIYRLIVEQASRGMAVILISSEMPEVLSISHRVKIMAAGQIVGEVDPKKTTQDQIMKIIVESRAKK